MTIIEMQGKINSSATVASRDLTTVVGGGSAEDFVSDGTIVEITEESTKGYYDERFGKNAVYVLMERCEPDAEGKLVNIHEAVQVNLSIFDRRAAAYKKEADGKVVRDLTRKDLVIASGTAVNDWRKAANAAQFMINNKGKRIKFTLADTITVRAWNSQSKTFSETETREQKVYNADWVN